MNGRFGATLVAAMIVASPAAAQDAVAAAPMSPVVQASEDEGAPPKPIEGVAATFRTPSRDAAGQYVTPNRDLSPEQAVWHLRVALNVAALGCRDADERATVAGYNALLANAKAALAAAATGTERRYQVQYGAKWRQRYDDDMTKLYNYFAQTPAQNEFCTAAKAVLTEVQAVPTADLAKLATSALPRLEGPFLAFYARYDSYREELVSWQARHAPLVAVATPAPQVAFATPAVPSVASPAASPVVIAAATPVVPLAAMLAAK